MITCYDIIKSLVRTEKGADLHWLDWLLTLGDKTIVIGYEYKPGTGGRSGGGTMTKGTAFRVSPSYSGTIEDNFITRAFSNKEKEVSSILMGIFEARWRVILVLSLVSSMAFIKAV